MLLSCSFESKLPEIFKDVHEAHSKIDARLKAEQFKVSFMFSNGRILTFSEKERGSLIHLAVIKNL